MTPSEQPELAPEIAAILARHAPGRTVAWVLNTHLHPDHVALNGWFASRGAQILNARTIPLPPEGLTIAGRLRFIPLPGAHTPEDAIAWDPESATLFVGDIFGWGLIPWDRPLTAETRDRIVAVYQRLLAFNPRHVVPGHGPVAGPDHLRRWLEYFAWLQCELRTLLARGVPEAALVAGDALPPPADLRDWWRFTQWKHRDSVKKVCRALRLGRL
ncbi:MAG: MBL fold metallo-hydrolase [Lentisphaeria bacterium]